MPRVTMESLSEGEDSPKNRLEYLATEDGAKWESLCSRLSLDAASATVVDVLTTLLDSLNK